MQGACVNDEGSVHRSTCRTEGVSLTKQKRSATLLYVEQPTRRITVTLLRHLVKRNACEAYTKFNGSKARGRYKNARAQKKAKKIGCSLTPLP